MFLEEMHEKLAIPSAIRFIAGVTRRRRTEKMYS